MHQPIRGIMDYWKSFWLNHAKSNRDAGSQIQVLRTLNKQPIKPEAFTAILESILTMLEPEQGHVLLDLCCGNGVITKELVGIFREITAVDLSEEFVSKLNIGITRNNIAAFAADARIVDFPSRSFDRILCYSGIQYFSESEIISLFIKLRRWIRDEGLVVLGDIPDAKRRWNFFNSPERESAYFEALGTEEPLVGNWFESGWLKKLSRHAGFMSAEIHPQPPTLPFQHYRFDLVLRAS